jgi:hypothetical protein
MPRFDRISAHVGVALGLLVSAATVAQGQSLDAISTGTRVRIDFPAAERSRFHRERVQSVIGTLDSVRADTVLLAVRPGAVPLRIPRAAIHSAYTSGGHPPRWRAAMNGAVVPAIVAAGLSAAGASIRRKPGQPTAGQMAASSAAWAGATGALLGAWSPKERWRPIP